jgi:hypothetical protein
MSFIGDYTVKSVEIILQLLFFMLSMSVLGEPWRILIRKFVGIFKSLDFLQILVFDVYLGGFLLYVISIIPLHLFSSITLYTVTILSVIVISWIHRRKFKSAIQNLSLHPKFSLPSHHSAVIILVASMFLFSLVVQTWPFNYLIFGSVRDTSIHSLFVQVIIENKQVPETMQPYSAAGIVYPQGFSVIAVFFVFIYDNLPPQAVFYVTSLFNSLSILGAYFLGKELSKKWNLGLSLGFVFAFFAFWPKFTTWGSNAFVASFPFYFVCLALFPFLTKEKLNLKAILVIGFLFGYLSVLHLQLYEMLMSALFIVWLYIAIRREKGAWSRLFSFILISLISLLVLSPFLYRALVFYQYPYHNIGLPTDVEIVSPHLDVPLILSGATSLFEHISINISLRIVSLAFFIVSVLMIVSFRRKESFRQTSELVKLGTATVIGELLIFLLGAVSPYNLPFYPNSLLLYFPFYFFIAAFNLSLYYFVSSYSSKKLLSKTSDSGLRKRKFLVVALSLTLLLGIYSPFLYQSIVLDGEALYSSYSVFSVTTEQDFQLLLWIKENLNVDATILVNTFQSGTFIPSVANRKIIFPPSAESSSISYQRLATMLENNVLNTTAFDLMKQFNITHIYVGAGVSSWDDWIHWWNPKLFLGNPNFNLVKNFGEAYLFNFTYTNASIVFLDDFDALWDQNGWQTSFDGNCLGQATVSSSFGYNDSRCLKMTAQIVPTATESEFASWVSREIYVLNNSRVAFSFYFNATVGFNGKDTFAVMISDSYHNQSLVMATPNGIYETYKDNIPLDRFEGFVEESDLNATWNQMFNSPLPNPFILEFVNCDFDGAQNVVYIDNVMVTSTPIV